MIIPQYWAEARLQEKLPARQITVRKFGWSDDSQFAAQQHADQRAREAMVSLLAGDVLLTRRERRVAYEADGLPIREEILSRHGTSIITRNIYGAECLNTPNVLFADLDFGQAKSGISGCLIALSLFAGAGLLLLGLLKQNPWVAAAGLMFVGRALYRWKVVTPVRLREDRVHQEAATRRRFDDFAAANPDRRLRLYRTPAGLRLLIMDRTFDPASEEVAALFTALGTDELYAQLCARQHCFRARLTPKPWRIPFSLAHHTPGRTWPVGPEHVEARKKWIADYEAAALGFAACEFVLETGTADPHPDALEVQRLHDQVCRATSGLPVA